MIEYVLFQVHSEDAAYDQIEAASGNSHQPDDAMEEQGRLNTAKHHKMGCP